MQGVSCRRVSHEDIGRGPDPGEGRVTITYRLATNSSIIGSVHAPMANMPQWLMQLFARQLKASPHYITWYPEDADYFFIDAWMFWQDISMLDVLAELRKKGPWFDRKNGSDHIFVISGVE